MSELEGQMSLFGEDGYEFTFYCPICHRVWCSYRPFPIDYECVCCKEKELKILEG